MIAAVDIGGTFVKLGLLKNQSVCIETKFSADSEAPFAETIRSIERGILNMLAKLGKEKNKIQAIGIGFPGIVDSKNLKVVSVNQKFNDAVHFDFQAWAAEKFHCPVTLENDARMALLGEWQYGAGKGFDDICMLTLGTGVGSAVLVEGKLLKGKHFQAGNLGGHFTVRINGAKCTCGNFGCVEAEASTWMLGQRLKSDLRYAKSPFKGKPLDFKLLFDVASQGDPMANDIKKQCLEVWAGCVINLIHAYDPELVILGGGVMKSADQIVPFVEKRVNERAWTPWGKVKIVPSKIPNKSALLGAAYTVKKMFDEN